MLNDCKISYTRGSVLQGLTRPLSLLYCPSESDAGDESRWFLRPGGCFLHAVSWKNCAKKTLMSVNEGPTLWSEPIPQQGEVPCALYPSRPEGFKAQKGLSHICLTVVKSRHLLSLSSAMPACWISRAMCFLSTLWATAVAQRVRAVPGVGWTRLVLISTTSTQSMGKRLKFTMFHLAVARVLWFSCSGNILARAWRLRVWTEGPHKTILGLRGKVGCIPGCGSKDTFKSQVQLVDDNKKCSFKLCMARLYLPFAFPLSLVSSSSLLHPLLLFHFGFGISLCPDLFKVCHPRRSGEL